MNPPCCDVLRALGDISIDFIRHEREGTTPGQAELSQWAQDLGEASYACQGLIVACEDVVELGATDARIAEMKAALTRALGQLTYTAREDRW